jgi:hypothetical protein
MTLAGLVIASWSTPVCAGPPYDTDDPEPVAYRHWEFYLASQSFNDRDGWNGTAPHFEVNYGVYPNVQLHLIAPLAFSVPRQAGSAYGVGDVELGVKLRFVQEGPILPQIGTFPFLEVPSGSERSGLGNGTTQVFLPLWLQKSYEQWTSYGGAGLWFDANRHGKRWLYLGWLLQRRFFDRFSIGAEVFHLTARDPGTQRDTRFNLGGVIDLNEVHHLLLSAGRGFTGPCRFQSYLAYQLTIGPSE